MPFTITAQISLATNAVNVGAFIGSINTSVLLISNLQMTNANLQVSGGYV